MDAPRKILFRSLWMPLKHNLRLGLLQRKILFRRFKTTEKNFPSQQTQKRKLHQKASFFGNFPRRCCSYRSNISRARRRPLFLPTCASYISTLRTVQCSVIYEEIYSKRINPFQKKKNEKDKFKRYFIPKLKIESYLFKKKIIFCCAFFPNSKRSIFSQSD